MVFEYDCVDCGLRVVCDFLRRVDGGGFIDGPPDNHPRCVGCNFLTGIDDKRHRDEAYDRLVQAGVIEPHRAVRAG